MMKFAAVGVLNTAIDFALFAALLFGAGWGLIAANSTSYLVAALNSYLVNKYWTFEDSSRGREMARRGVLFLAFGLVGLGLANFTIWILAKAMPALLAKIGAVAVAFVWNYSTNRRFVYRPQ